MNPSHRNMADYHTAPLMLIGPAVDCRRSSRDPQAHVTTEFPMKLTPRALANWQRVYAMSFASVYPMYVKKAESKGRTKAEVDQVIRWLTGYTQKGLDAQIEKKTSYETFFAKAPKLNPARDQITGVICGMRVETIEEPLMQNIRYIDKLIDELAKGKAMEKILRK
jgi:hypothetical protein